MELTNKSKTVQIAEVLGLADRWFIVKRGMYYRPNGHGYTNCQQEAWLVTEAEADTHVYPHDEPVTKVRAPMPDFFGCLNACQSAFGKLNDEQKRACTFHVINQLEKGQFLFDATPAQWATSIHAILCH